MRKKGFTIVELISVIVVLTIIILIAVPAYGSIQNSINKKNKENEINLIKVAAEKYAEDYNVTAVFVKDLIDAGYIDPNEAESIVDPTDKDKNWDCSIVTITTTKDIRTATFNEKSYKSDDSNVCDYNKINDLNGALKIVMSDSKGEITKDTNYWTKEDVRLSLQLNDSSISLNNAKITWYKGSQEMQGQNSPSIIVYGINNSVLTQKYQARVEVDNNKYLALVTVQIDRVRPEFYSNDGVKDGVNTDTGWLKETTYKAKAYDTGSGLYGYAIVKDDNETINDCSTQTYTKADSMKITSIGKYTICLRDAAGNVTEPPKRYPLQYIDKTKIAAGVSVTGTSGESGWYVGNGVTITVSSNTTGDSGLTYVLNVSDDASKKNLLSDTQVYNVYHAGDRGSLQKSYTRTANGKGITFEGKVCTRANQCDTKTATINYERVMDSGGTVKVERPNNAYDQVKATVSGASATSGIKEYTYQLYKNDVAKGNPVTTSSNTYTFTGLADKDYTYTYKVTAVVKSNAGNTINATAGSVSLPGYCTSGQTKTPVITYSPRGNYYGCTNTCGGGTEYKDATKNTKVYSNYNNTLCTNTDEVSSKYYSQTCGGTNSTYGSTSDGACSNKCGGTLTRTYYYYSTVEAGKVCKTTTGSVNCGGVSENYKNYSDGACSDVCGGTLTRTYNYYSSIDSNVYCKSTTGSISCGGHTPTPTYDYGACSDACGGTQSVTTKYLSYDGSKWCDSSTGSQGCGGTKSPTNGDVYYIHHDIYYNSNCPDTSNDKIRAYQVKCTQQTIKSSDGSKNCSKQIKFSNKDGSSTKVSTANTCSIANYWALGYDATSHSYMTAWHSCDSGNWHQTTFTDCKKIKLDYASGSSCGGGGKGYYYDGSNVHDWYMNTTSYWSNKDLWS